MILLLCFDSVFFFFFLPKWCSCNTENMKFFNTNNTAGKEFKAYSCFLFILFYFLYFVLNCLFSLLNNFFHLDRAANLAACEVVINYKNLVGKFHRETEGNKTHALAEPFCGAPSIIYEQRDTRFRNISQRADLFLSRLSASRFFPSVRRERPAGCSRAYAR